VAPVEPVPDDDRMDEDLSELVAAYWTQHRLSQGGRTQRLESDAYFWAWERVEDDVERADDRALTVLDALLDAPEADAAYVGAGPTEELVQITDARIIAAIESRCRQSALWRAAVSTVNWDDNDRERLSPLLPYLPA
jgi:hypothetical protein